LNHVNPGIKTFRREWSGLPRTSFAIKNLDPDCNHYYRWHLCNYLLLFTYVAHSNVLNCTYSGTTF